MRVYFIHVVWYDMIVVLLYVWYDCGMFVYPPHEPIHNVDASTFLFLVCLAFICFGYEFLRRLVYMEWM